MRYVIHRSLSVKAIGGSTILNVAKKLTDSSQTISANEVTEGTFAIKPHLIPDIVAKSRLVETEILCDDDLPAYWKSMERRVQTKRSKLRNEAGDKVGRGERNATPWDAVDPYSN
jgi:hypothetical protein